MPSSRRDAIVHREILIIAPQQIIADEPLRRTVPFKRSGWALACESARPATTPCVIGEITPRPTVRGMFCEPTRPIGAQPATIREALLEVGPRTARAAGLPANWCLAAAAMTRNVYADFGYPGVRVLGVKATAYNEAGWHQWLRGIPLSDWPDEAWSVGIRATGRLSEGTWDGHAVAYVPAKIGGGKAWLVDLSAPQMSRPDHGIDVPPLALPVDGSFYDGDMWSCTLPGGSTLTLSAVPALTRSAHQQIAAAGPSIKCLSDLCSSSISTDLRAALIA